MSRYGFRMKKSRFKLSKFSLNVRIFLCCLFLLTIFAIYHWVKHPKAVGPQWKVTHPWFETMDIEHDYVAQIRAIEHIAVRSLEKGYLEHIYVDEGDFVKKGKKMFQVMPLIFRAERDKTKAEYDIARIEYENTRMLAARNVVSANALALSKAKLNEAQARMQLADIHLAFTTIKAPFDGIVGQFRVRLGSLLDQGQILTTMSDNCVMWVYFNVTEEDYLNFMGQRKHSDQKIPVKLELANGKRFNQKGFIDTIEADFNNQTGNIAFRASFPNPDNLLRHGQTGNVILTEHLHHVLVIPQKTVFEVLDKRYVYVIDKDNKITSREIIVTKEVPYLYIIQSGLKQTDTILLEGLGKAKLGQTILPYYMSPESVKASFNLPVH